jgi:hypothetical protein
LSNGSLSINNALVNVRELELSGGSLSGSGALSVTHNFTQTDGVINKTGSLSITQSSGNLVLGNITAGSLNLVANGGDIVQTAGKAIVARGGAVTVNSVGNVTMAGSIDTSGNAGDDSDGGTGGNVSIISSGIVLIHQVDTSGGAAIGEFFGGYAGTVTVRAAGNLSVNGSGARIWAKGGGHPDPLQRGWGREIKLIAGQNAELKQSSTGGNVTLSGVTIDASGAFSGQVSITALEGTDLPSSPPRPGSVFLNSGTVITAGDIDINAGNDLAITGATLTANSGTIVLRAGWNPGGERIGGASTQGGSMTLTDSTLEASSIELAAAAGSLSAGTMDITGSSLSTGYGGYVIASAAGDLTPAPLVHR